MKKSLIIFFIIFLISFTAWVKNSSKNLEDEIFIVQENLKELKKELGDTKLEFDYLSSAEKLLEYQILYFDEDLVQKDINEIVIIKKDIRKLLVEDLGKLTKN